MGLFDSISKRTSEVKLDAREAFAATLLAVIAADGAISNEECDDFIARVSRMKLYEGLDTKALLEIVRKLHNIANLEGSANLAALGAKALPAKLKEIAYCNALDLAFADGTLHRKEKSLIKDLAKLLSIESARAEQISEVIRIKNGG